jgi:hypothetical protein
LVRGDCKSFGKINPEGVVMTDLIKPSLNFTIICDDVRQEMGGKLSLMGLFENIYAAKFPAVHPRMAIVTEWSSGQGEFRTRMRILTPDGKTVIRETNSKMSLNGVNYRHRDVSLHLNVELKTPGAYWVENYLDDELINSLPLNVVQVKEQPVH